MEQPLPPFGLASLPQTGNQELEAVGGGGDCVQFAQELLLTAITFGPTGDLFFIGHDAAGQAHEGIGGTTVLADEEINRFQAGVAGIAHQEHRLADLELHPEHVLDPARFFIKHIRMKACRNRSRYGTLVVSAQIDDAVSLLALSNLPQKVFHADGSFHFDGRKQQEGCENIFM